MNRLQIKISTIGMARREHKEGKAGEEDHYRNPPQGFTKLNFDGAGKGNLGEASIGGIFRDDGGRICWVYAMDCGMASNNEVVFWVLNRGIVIVIIEG